MDTSLPRAGAFGRSALAAAGGAAALILAMLLLVGITGLFTADGQAGVSFPNNFLVIIFKLHSGSSGVAVDDLTGVNLPDLAIIMLTGLMALALYPLLKPVSRAWALVGAALPFVGLVLFILTQDIGRSGVLAADLVLAALMLRADAFGRRTAATGVVAAACLLVGDVGTAFAYTPMLAIILGLGYLMSLGWHVLVGWRLMAGAALAGQPQPAQSRRSSE